MKNKGSKKSKRIYFLLICLVISIATIFSSTANAYAYNFLIGYPVVYPVTLAMRIYNSYLYNSVEQELSKIPGVEIVNMNFYHDEHYVNPLVRVKSKGLLLFINLHKDSFYNPPHLTVKSFGDVTRLLQYINKGIHENREK